MTLNDLLEIYPFESIRDFILMTPVKIDLGGPGGGYICKEKEFNRIRIDFNEKKVILY